MSNVIQFPTERVREKKGNKVGEYKRKMINLAKMLDARYEHLHELTQTMNMVTEECEKFEKDYEILLKAYAERVGPENVEIKFYDYSAEVDIAFDPDHNTFYIEDVDRTADHREHVEEVYEDDGGDIA